MKFVVIAYIVLITIKMLKTSAAAQIHDFIRV